MRPDVPQDSSSEEDDIDVVEVQGEGEDHHAQKRQAVHDQSRHPVKKEKSSMILCLKEQPVKSVQNLKAGVSVCPLSLSRVSFAFDCNYSDR